MAQSGNWTKFAGNLPDGAAIVMDAAARLVAIGLLAGNACRNITPPMFKMQDNYFHRALLLAAIMPR
jgi:hypothetical protein